MKQKLFSIAALLVLGLFGCADRKEVTTPQTPPLDSSAALVGETYRVKRIADGDTITVVDGQNKNVKVRFACVDAPEVAHTKQERESYNPVDLDQFRWGKQALDRLTGLIEQGGDRVSLTVADTDRYGLGCRSSLARWHSCSGSISP